MAELPVLYSFKRCPYAIRARIALAASSMSYQRIEVDLKNKPPALLALSPKGTVPVLQLEGGLVIDESLDIMRHALRLRDPEDWLASEEASLALIARNDQEFKPLLDKFKYHTRHPEATQAQHQAGGRNILGDLETRLCRSGFLLASAPRLADIAIFPFIRQWAGVSPGALEGFPKLAAWLEYHKKSEPFKAAMQA